MVVGIVFLCVVISIVILCIMRRKRKPHAIPTSKKKAGHNINQAYQPYGVATATSEPSPHGENEEICLFFLMAVAKHSIYH